MLLKDAIRVNTIKQGRYSRAEKVLRAIRQRVFDYEDMGKLSKAHHVMDTCRRILAPLWEQQHRNAENRRLQNYMI